MMSDTGGECRRSGRFPPECPARNPGPWGGTVDAAVLRRNGSLNSMRTGKIRDWMQPRAWLAGLPAHLVVDQGRLVAAPAGVEHGHVGGQSLRTHTDAPWGPQKARWWNTHYGASHTVVYGHYAVADPGTARGRCICIDARCGFPGGALMACRHPETTRVMVPMVQSEHECIEHGTKRAGAS